MSTLLYDNEPVTQMPDDATVVQLLNQAETYITSMAMCLMAVTLMLGDNPEVTDLMVNSVDWCIETRKALGVRFIAEPIASFA